MKYFKLLVIENEYNLELDWEKRMISLIRYFKGKYNFMWFLNNGGKT
jgi:hypothetical protein